MKDKVVIVTGASSGIGKALALEFAAHHSKLVLAARNIDSLKMLAASMKLDSNDYLIVQTDVTIENDCKELISKAIDKFGKIDILINNAGISMRANFEQVDMNVIRQVIDVNFWGAVYCTKYAIPYLQATKGSLVGISSIAGYKGLPGRTGYSASKFALQGFLEVLRLENRDKGLHVLIACPGFTASNIRNSALTADGSLQGESPRDEGKMMSAETVAARIYKAVLKRKRSLVLTTEGKAVVFLNKFFPAWVDKMVSAHISKEPGSPV